jgi:hypothetical protein
MDRVVKVAVVLALLYLAYAKGLPWLKTFFNGSEGTSSTSVAGGGSRCVDLASQASTALGGEIGRFRQPPVDLGAWGDAFSRVQARISEAQVECGCPLASCRKASEALLTLDSLLNDLDTTFRGDAAHPGNPARRQERVDGLLDEARRLAREGR